MWIKKLEMKHFRGFEELTVQFPEKGSAVFVGVNGSGKTSLLEATMLLLMTIMEYQGLQKFDKIFKESFLKTGDINRRFYQVENKLELSAENKTYTAKMIVNYDGGQSNSRFKNLWKDLIQESYLNSKKKIPFFAFYPTNRMVLNKPNLSIKDLSYEDQVNAFSKKMSTNIDFEDFFEWFRNTEDLENEIRLQEDNKYRNPKLGIVRKALKSFLPNISNIRIKRKGILEFIFEKDDEQLSLSNLSHGEKGMLTLIGDIARRLSIANPSLENPLDGEGIILIDEIELHLHPKWQRIIVPSLEKTFPNIQFILTTHSPQVLSSMKRENVFILENFKLVKNTPHTFGKDSNSILYDLFGVSERPDEAKKEFKKLYRLIDDVNKVEEAKEEYERMKNKYGEFDAEIVRARIHFDFLTK